MRRIVSLSLLGALVTATPAAFAADIPRPVYKAPRTVYAAYNWTGFYVGAHVGYGWSNFTGTDLVFGDTTTSRADGFLGGFQGGYNYQIGSFLIGVEGEYSISDVKINLNDPLGLGVGEATLKNDFFAIAALRLGYAFDRTLIYAKGGAAWTRDKLDVNDGLGGTATGRFNRTGWMAGGGVEYAFLGNWSAKLEYNYLKFGSITEQPDTAGGLAATPASVKLDTHLIKLGVNYRFF